MDQLGVKASTSHSTPGALGMPRSSAGVGVCERVLQPPMHVVVDRDVVGRRKFRHLVEARRSRVDPRLTGHRDVSECGELLTRHTTNGSAPDVALRPTASLPSSHESSSASSCESCSA